jgi:murein DD-endopeptidase MepM/ murein hydrolase activator NlpD
MKDSRVRNNKNIAMKKIIIAAILMILAGAVFVLAKNSLRKNNPVVPKKNISADIPASDNQNPSQSTASAPSDNKNVSPLQNSSGFLPPLDRAAERVTKKPFGIYITPKTSPVQPERFQGYHTGTDFEIFAEELDADVPIHAICSGKIAVKRSASGYGGVLVHSCVLENQPITVVYGHLKLASIKKSAGDTLNAGDEIGILGKAYSSETDGERKHLHLGMSKGSATNILGYVSSQSQLSGWIDPCSLVCK